MIKKYLFLALSFLVSTTTQAANPHEVTKMTIACEDNATMNEFKKTTKEDGTFLAVTTEAKKQKVSFHLLKRTQHIQRSIYQGQRFFVRSQHTFNGALGSFVSEISTLNKKLLRSEVVFECTNPSNILQLGTTNMILTPQLEPVEIVLSEDGYLTVYEKAKS
jgi:hypothetical protein